MTLEKAVKEYKQYGLVSRDLVGALVERFEMTQKFRILWERDPRSSTISFGGSVAVECWFGGVVIKAFVSIYEFPLNYEKQERLECQLKVRCLQEYAKDLPVGRV